MVKNLTVNAGDVDSITGSGRSPGEGNGNPLQYFLPGKFHGQRRLAGYSPWDCKELNTTKHMHAQCEYKFDKHQKSNNLIEILLTFKQMFKQINLPLL